MNEDDIIYGVGESNRGINKNIGMHRYGGIWTGDNKSWWSHILLNLKMMPSLNMCGFLYTGADLGGFGADTAREFLLRHLALGVFIPLISFPSISGINTPSARCIYPADARK